MPTLKCKIILVQQLLHADKWEENKIQILRIIPTTNRFVSPESLRTKNDGGNYIFPKIELNYAPYHMYLISEREIRMDDWHINEDVVIHTGHVEYTAYKATQVKFDWMKKLAINNSSCKFYKIEATTNPLCNLPGISHAFIHSYLKTPIKDVEIETAYPMKAVSRNGNSFPYNGDAEAVPAYELEPYVITDNNGWALISRNTTAKTYTREEIKDKFEKLATQIRATQECNRTPPAYVVTRQEIMNFYNACYSQ